MAGEITTIRDGLETRLETISDLEVLDHEPDGTTVTPAATIRLDSLTRNETFEGASVPGDRTYRFIITLRLAGATKPSASARPRGPDSRRCRGVGDDPAR